MCIHVRVIYTRYQYICTQKFDTQNKSGRERLWCFFSVILLLFLLCPLTTRKSCGLRQHNYVYQKYQVQIVAKTFTQKYVYKGMYFRSRISSRQHIPTGFSLCTLLVYTCMCMMLFLCKNMLLLCVSKYMRNLSKNMSYGSHCICILDKLIW